MTEEKVTCGQCMKFTSYKNPSDGRGFCNAEVPAWVMSEVYDYSDASQFDANCNFAETCDLFNPRKISKDTHACLLNMIMDGTCSVCGKMVEEPDDK
jgi:endogenous inhibitor of DNA gyrase (YacG/DUF329 family)